MTYSQVSRSVVVGIGGSDAAIAAALWAADEAIAPDVPLRLLHAAQDGGAPDQPGHGFQRTDQTRRNAVMCRRRGREGDRQDGQNRNNRCQRGTTGGAGQRNPQDGNGVRRLRRGEAPRRHAAGLNSCHGGKRGILSVAIMRTGAATPDSGSIAVAVDDSPERNVVVEHAFERGRAAQRATAGAKSRALRKPFRLAGSAPETLA